MRSFTIIRQAEWVWPGLAEATGSLAVVGFKTAGYARPGVGRLAGALLVVAQGSWLEWLRQLFEFIGNHPRTSC